MNYSTEMALYKILNDFRFNNEAESEALLVLSVTFDTMDYTILLSRLKQIGYSIILSGSFCLAWAERLVRVD